MNILTFDIEDWFHILDNTSTKTAAEWSRYETRIHEGVDKILETLESNRLQATFFCLGWIAEKYPGVIKKIHAQGHEIGSHSYHHQLVYEQTPQQFQNDLILSLNILENLIGKKVTCYRSPGFSIMENCFWAFDILAENGIDIDCSIFPAKRAHGGAPSLFHKKPFLIEGNGFRIKEFPMSVFGRNGINVPYSGGGYFRLLPYTFIKRLAQNSDYVMTYFHPRDFDDGQPVLTDLSFLRRFKSYYGVAGAFDKLVTLLGDFQFDSVTQADKKIDWSSVARIKLS